MSGVLSVINAIGSWRAGLLPGSFRGVPFFIESSELEGGRRIVTHEFPARDEPYTEDLGRAAQRHRIRCFVVGDDYMDERDALLLACQDWAGPGLLVHPTLGEMYCRAGKVRLHEMPTERGGIATFDIEFVVDGLQPSPVAGDDTASALLSGLGSATDAISAAYQAASMVLANPLAVLSQTGDLLGLAADAFSALPPFTVDALAPLIDAVTASPFNDLATTVAMGAFFGAAADAVVAARQPNLVTGDAVSGTILPSPPSADPSGGLAALAAWGGDLPLTTGASPQAVAQAAQQAAVVALVRGFATTAVAQIYAQIDWPYADAATAARQQLLALLDDRSDAAADAGHDDLYRAWQGITTLAVRDLIGRAQNLPNLDSYAVPASLPSDVLAMRLYADPARAAELEDLNAVQHPMFMPFDGLRLSA